MKKIDQKYAAKQPVNSPKPALHRSGQFYVTSRHIAADYDSYFTYQNLFKLDTQYLDQWFNPPGKVLDLGCGTGRQVFHFARQGFDTTGVDLSEHMLNITRDKLTKHNLNAKLIQADFTKLLDNNDIAQSIAESPFDYACCMFSTLGMIEGRKNRENVLKIIFSILKPHGKLTLHVHNRGINLTRHEGRVFLINNSIKTLFNIEEFGDKIIPNYRGIKNMFVHIFSEPEIRNLLTIAGFKIIRLQRVNASHNGCITGGLFKNIRTSGFLILAERIE